MQATDNRLTNDFKTLIDLNIFTMASVKSIIPGLTYRQVGSWDNQGLVHHDRMTTNTGWRRFSMKDAIKLQIISALRRFGLPALMVKYCLASLESQFGDYCYKAVKKNKVLLLIRTGGKAEFFISNSNTDAFFLNDCASDPLLLLPFSDYVTRLKGDARNADKKETIVERLIADTLSGDDMRITQSVRDIKQADFIMRMPDGGRFIIDAKHTMHMA